MNRDRLKKYAPSYTRKEILFEIDNDKKEIKDFLKKVTEANDTLKNWQENVITLLSNSKKSLKKSIDNSDLGEQQLCLLNYLKLRSIYKLAECLSVKINEFVNDDDNHCYQRKDFGKQSKEFRKLYDDLQEIERIVFHFIDFFNVRIDDCLDSNDKKTFDWMCQNINGLEGRITSSEDENIKKLLGNIKDVEVMPGYSYSKIVDFIRNGKKEDAVYDKAIKCKDWKITSIIFN